MYGFSLCAWANGAHLVRYYLCCTTYISMHDETEHCHAYTPTYRAVALRDNESAQIVMPVVRLTYSLYTLSYTRPYVYQGIPGIT
jgi:hypothetical protein